MKNIFNSTVLNTLTLVIAGITSIFTREIVTFFMLGFVLIMLSNIYDKLDDVSKKIDKK